MNRLEIDSHTVETSSLDRVMFPRDGITKGELIDYYRRIADPMVPHMRDRPLSMRRYPDGIAGQGFYHQEAPEYFPDWISRVTVDKEGGEIVHAVCNEAATLVYLANQNTITPHVWLSRVGHLRKPDQMVFDLDPSGDDFEDVRRAARYVREILEDHHLGAFLMSTGSRGVHVRTPIRPEHDFDVVRQFARKLMEKLADAYPDELTTEQRKVKRRGRIYLDIMRIAYAQTAVTPYAVRAIEGAPVAAPLEWKELGDFTPGRYTIRNIFRRMGQKEDPWKDMHRHAATIPLERSGAQNSPPE